MSNFNYVGNELDLFENATNWKNYWSSLLKPHIIGNVLEVGAGLGTNTRYLVNDSVESWVSIEPDAMLCETIKNNYNEKINNIKLEVLNKKLVELNDGRHFDSILYIDVLEHIENDKAEIEKAYGLLKVGGKLIVLSPAHEFLFSPFDKSVGHVRRYSKKTISKLLPWGASVIELIYLDSLGLFASLANKLLLRQSVPTISQIKFWDTYIVPGSKIVDRLTFNLAGKSIVWILEKN